MAIRYVAYTSEGRKVSGTLSVETPEAAEELLWRSELIVTSLKRERPVRQEVLRQVYRQMPTLFRPKARDLVGFTRELATLLRAGIPLHTSLTILMDRITNPLLKDAVSQISQDIEAGGTISAAIARHPSIFPTMYSRLITVGEETGRLEMALNQIANYIEKQAVLTRKVTGALRYPAFVALVALGAGFFLVSFTLPSLVGLFKEYGGEMPIAARILMGLSDLSENFGKWALLTMVLLTVGLWLYFRTASGARKKDSLVIGMPVVGKVVRLAAMFRFTSSLHTLLAAGLPLTEALDLTAMTTGNTRIQEAMTHTQQEVLAGQSLSQALGHQALFPPLIPQMVEVGERAGTLGQNLETLSTFFDEETDRTIAGLTGMIEPAMILMIGGGVGFVAVAVMSSLYGIIGQIK